MKRREAGKLPLYGKSRRTNTLPRINQKKGKSGERKGCTLAKTRAKRYVPDVVGKVALVTLIMSFILGAISITSFEDWLHPMRDGVPTIFRRDSEYWSEAETPIVAENRLYLLFNTLNIVKVYDLQGNYQYTINFSNRRRNGLSSLCAQGDEMYYRDTWDKSEIYYLRMTSS